MALSASHLEAFATCAQLGSFTQAAERLHITQSALSQRIMNLEEDLGMTLLIRERAGLRLTEAGESLLRYCKTKDHLETELLQRLRGPGEGGLRGQLRIGGFSSIVRSLVLPAMAPLLREHPGLQLKLLTQELYELPALLKSGAIDYMILDEELKLDGVVAHRLGHERCVLVQKRGYRGPDVYLDHDEKDVTTFRYFESGSASKARSAWRKKSAAGLQHRYLDDIYGIIDGVRLGLGRAVLPLHLIQGASDLEVLEPRRTFDVPVVLHHYEQPYTTRLHEAVTRALKGLERSLQSS